MTLLRRCMKGIEYFHATLIFAVLIPLVCAVCFTSDPAGTTIFYLKCLLIAIPILLTDYAIRHIRNLILYVFFCIVVLAVMGGIVFGFLYMTKRNGGGGLYQMCYSIGILVETIAVAIMRFCDRIKAARRERGPTGARRTRFFEFSSALARMVFCCALSDWNLCDSQSAV